MNPTNKSEIPRYMVPIIPCISFNCWCCLPTCLPTYYNDTSSRDPYRPGVKGFQGHGVKGTSLTDE